MIITKYENAETGILAYVKVADAGDVHPNGIYNVIARDTDADQTIEIRKGFATLGAAMQYAQSFTNGDIPPNTFVSL